MVLILVGGLAFSLQILCPRRPMLGYAMRVCYVQQAFFFSSSCVCGFARVDVQPKLVVCCSWSSLLCCRLLPSMACWPYQPIDAARCWCFYLVFAVCSLGLPSFCASTQHVAALVSRLRFLFRRGCNSSGLVMAAAPYYCRCSLYQLSCCRSGVFVFFSRNILVLAFSFGAQFVCGGLDCL